jgi:hypothetical protein
LILADNTRYPQHGRPQSLDRAVNPNTGTIAVQGTFPNPPGSLDILRFDPEALAMAQPADPRTILHVMKETTVGLPTNTVQ